MLNHYTLDQQVVCRSRARISATRRLADPKEHRPRRSDHSGAIGCRRILPGGRGLIGVANMPFKIGDAKLLLRIDAAQALSGQQALQLLLPGLRSGRLAINHQSIAGNKVGAGRSVFVIGRAQREHVL